MILELGTIRKGWFTPLVIAIYQVFECEILNIRANFMKNQSRLMMSKMFISIANRFKINKKTAINSRSLGSVLKFNRNNE